MKTERFQNDHGSGAAAQGGMTRRQAWQAYVAAENKVRASEARRSAAVRLARRFGRVKLIAHRRAESPLDAIAGATMFIIERSKAPQAYSVASGSFNLMVITTQFLSMLEVAAPLLAKAAWLRGEGSLKLGSEKAIGQALAMIIASADPRRECEALVDDLLGDLVEDERLGRWAGAFLEFMIVFVLEHEWAHAHAGHLELPTISYESGPRILDAPLWTGVGNLLRTCEVDADVRALHAALSFAAPRLVGWVNSESVETKVALRDFAITTAIPLTFLMRLEETYPTDYAEIRWRDHPPGFYRANFLAHHTGLWLEERGIADATGDPSHQPSAGYSDWQECSIMFQRATGLSLTEVLQERLIAMPSDEAFVAYVTTHSGGLRRWPWLHNLCMHSLVARVAGVEIAERSREVWEDSAGSTTEVVEPNDGLSEPSQLRVKLEEGEWSR